MKNKKTPFWIYLVVCFLLVLDVSLYLMFRISYVGYWSDRIVFWFWLILTPVVIICFWKKLVAKIYFWLLATALVLSIIPMALPFFGIVLAGSGRGRFNHFSLANGFKVQTVGYGVMGRPRLQVVKDGLIFDKVLLETGDEIDINDSTRFEIRDAKSAQLIEEKPKEITVNYFFDKDTVQAVHRFENTGLLY